MKFIKHLSIFILLFSYSYGFAQKTKTETHSEKFPAPKFTIEPGIGINPAPMPDIVLSNLMQWNIKKRLSIVSHTSLNFNGPLKRNFNYITTNYNYSIIQKLGIGTSVYTKRSSHTFSLLAGIRYDGYKETMNNPEFEKVIVKINSLNPDFGLMYNVKVGQKKVFFSYRMYVPLYPYPVKGLDFSSIDGNLANVSLEFGVGFRMK